MPIRFHRFAGNPIIPRTAGSFYSIHVANPDILLFQGEYYFYFRGQAEAGHDQIGVALATPAQFDGIHWNMCPENPILKVGAKPSDFDSGHILDPATIVLNGQVWLYYSAHNIDWKKRNVPSGVGLAISSDGIHFEKHAENPVVIGTAPEVVLFQNQVYLFFQRKNQDGFFEIFCRQGTDGIHFPESSTTRVFAPSGKPGTFDQFSISTVRIWQEGNWFYMTYGGCPRFFDYPSAIGLTRSRDLLHWERYPHNPIFERGPAGSWDEAALWFATVLKKENQYYLWYEGAGTGLELATPAAIEASEQCRNQDYGGYRQFSFSQIGLATFQGEIEDW